MDLHGALGGVAPAAAERMIFFTGGAFTREARDFIARSHTCVAKPIDVKHLARWSPPGFPRSEHPEPARRGVGRRARNERENGVAPATRR